MQANFLGKKRMNHWNLTEFKQHTVQSMIKLSFVIAVFYFKNAEKLDIKKKFFGFVQNVHEMRKP